MWWAWLQLQQLTVHVKMSRKRPHIDDQEPTTGENAVLQPEDYVSQQRYRCDVAHIHTCTWIASHAYITAKLNI